MFSIDGTEGVPLELGSAPLVISTGLVAEPGIVDGMGTDGDCASSLAEMQCRSKIVKENCRNRVFIMARFNPLTALVVWH